LRFEREEAILTIKNIIVAAIAKTIKKGRNVQIDIFIIN
jgi:hypothetical protein